MLSLTLRRSRANILLSLAKLPLNTGQMFYSLVEQVRERGGLAPRDAHVEAVRVVEGKDRSGAASGDGEGGGHARQSTMKVRVRWFRGKRYQAFRKAMARGRESRAIFPAPG